MTGAAGFCLSPASSRSAPGCWCRSTSSALGAFGGPRRRVHSWPKTLWPTQASLEPCCALPAASRACGTPLLNSRRSPPALTHGLFASLLGAPAGYALARFASAARRLPAADPADARLPARHPGAAAHRELHPAGTLRHAVRRLASCTPRWPCPSRRWSRPSLFLGIPREFEEAAWVFGCTRLAGLPAASCCRWPCRASRRPRSSPS